MNAVHRCKTIAKNLRLDRHENDEWSESVNE